MRGKLQAPSTGFRIIDATASSMRLWTSLSILSRAAPPRDNDPSSDSFVLRCGSQSALALRDGLAPILGLPKERLKNSTRATASSNLVGLG